MAQPQPLTNFGYRTDFTTIALTSLGDWDNASVLVDGSTVVYDATAAKFKAGPSASSGLTADASVDRLDDRVARFSGATGLVLGGSVVSISETGVVSNVAAPIANGDAVNKEYVDVAVSLGLRFVEPVAAASVAAIASLSGAQTIDGVALVAGQRVLVKNGTSAAPGSTSTDNGIYAVAAGAWGRAADAPLGGNASGVTCAVDSGVVNNNTIFTCNTTGAVFGDAISFARIASFSDLSVPSTSTDTAVVRWTGAGGNEVANSLLTVSDTGAVAGARSLAMVGSSSGIVTLQPAAASSTHTLTLPAAAGAAGRVLACADGAGGLAWVATGDVVGPSAATDNAVARFDLATGKLLQGSGVTINDVAEVSGVKALALSGSASGALTMRAASVTTPYSVTFPGAVGASGLYLRSTDGAGALAWDTAGDASGPAGASANSVARFDGTTGKLLRNSLVSISDAGDVSGVAQLTVTGQVTGLPTPVAASNATNKAYVDNAIAGLRWKEPANVTTTVNIAALSGLLVVDGVTLVAGDRVLVRAQTTGAQNGIYVAAAGAWARSADLLAGSGAAAVSLFTLNGTIYEGYGWVCSNTTGTDVVGTDALVFVQFLANAGLQGPASSVDNAVVRFESTTGKMLQNSGVTISDTADIAGAKTIALSGSVSGVLTVQPGATTISHTLTMPSAQGAASTYLQNNGSGGLSWATTGDVSGPASATDNAVARFDLATGKLLQNSGVTISDTAGIAGAKTIAMSGATSGVLTIQPAATTTNHTLTMPSAQGAASTYLQNNGSGSLSWAEAGDASGPASATDNAVARFDATSGKLLQNSGVTISDTADVAGAKTLGLSGSVSGVLTVQPSATTTNYTLTMPSTQGAAGTLLSNNGTGSLSWLTVAGAGPPIKGMRTITASGTYTPTAGTTRAVVYATGGGGSGGGVTATPNNAASSGGDGAGTYVGLFAIDDTNTGTVTIGVGGTGGTGAGANGTNTTFLFPATGTPSGTITGNFGRGGTADTSSADEQFTPNIAADAGGSASAINAVFLGGYSIEGTHGTYGLTIAPDYGISGAGGRSFFADGGRAYAINNTNSRINGTVGGTGAGGSGAIQTNKDQSGTGGNGGSGQILIMEY